MRRATAIVLLIIGISISIHQHARGQSQVAAVPIEGLRDNRPDDYALTGATVIASPNQTISNATVLMRDTTIIAVGKDVAVPDGFMTIDCTDRTIYPGLIDAFSEREVPYEPTESTASYWNQNVTPERSAKRIAAKLPDSADKLRSQGITVRMVAPKGGIVKGRSAVAVLNDESRGRSLLKPNAWYHAQLTVPKDRLGESYPNSPMGAVALLRQSFYDARWYGKAWEAYRASPTLPRPETNTALAVLSEAIRNDTFVFDAPNERMALRADGIAKEFSLRAILRGSGREYRRIEQIAATNRPVLLPVDFPEAPDVHTMAAARDVTLQDLLHWHFAPQNPALLASAGVSVCLTTDGLDDLSQFLEQVRLAVQEGLPEEEALAALTTTPAKLLEIDSHVGQIRPGMLANLVITDGPLFQSDTKVLETWIAGQQFVIDESNEPLLDQVVGTWEMRFRSPIGSSTFFTKLQRKGDKLEGKLSSSLDDLDGNESKEDDSDDGEGDEGEDAEGENDEGENADKDAAKDKSTTIPLRQLTRTRDRLTAIAELQKLDDAFPSGESSLTWITIEQEEGPPSVLGKIIFPDGRQEEVDVRWREIDSIDDESTSEDEQGGDEDETESSSDEASAPEDISDHAEEAVASIDLMFPLGAYGLTESIDQPVAVLFRGATVWTSDEAGTLEKADVLVRRGLIEDVGENLAVPSDCVIVDARGKHITPGLIDCHSHMATDGGVNESGQAVTAEVRIGDFIDNSDITIYRQLAGGLTVANVLHGSANPIGGQNQVIKLRWGQTMDGLKMKEAPAGIKFALGENVKRSQSRYPNTRMGVEQILRDQLLAAREYEAAWRRWHRGDRDSLPPRVDLQLEAMSEVQHGERWIHCHSYRQDEIVATLDVLDEFGVQIGTLQHILEGYKVADRMAKHGAMGSSFSDWWAYKFEVYDAIPYNGALMHDQGVTVSFNSDDRELGRRLNTEAAKATKYGAISEEEALKFVTLNPAKQLRIDQFVGSIAKGKHADLVVWSGPPLSTTTRCEQTWVDGMQYFDRERDEELRRRDAKLRAQLVQMAIDGKLKGMRFARRRRSKRKTAGNVTTSFVVQVVDRK